MSEKLTKENHNIGWPFAGVVTAYTLHQHSSSLQPMSMVRFSLRQYPRFIAMQRSSGWRDVMGIAAIDCAQEENMPTCREYEVTPTNSERVTEILLILGDGVPQHQVLLTGNPCRGHGGGES